MKLEPGDILVNVNTRQDLKSKIMRAASGEYEHVFIYVGKVFNSPFLFESSTRGVCYKALSSRYGQCVEVLRPQLTKEDKEEVIKTSIEIGSLDTSSYDYKDIFIYAIPRILYRKFPSLQEHFPMYVNDKQFICSEAVAECFYRNGYEIVPSNVIPLPEDFVYSDMVDKLGRISLSEKIV